MVTTLCTTQDVLDRCGIKANAAIIASSAIVDRYINTSEGTIVAETKINFVVDYAKVPAAVKESLRICTASHAANAIIKQDMGGFTSRAESITMLNVNYEDFNRTLKSLKDLDTIKIRSIE